MFPLTFEDHQLTCVTGSLFVIKKSHSPSFGYYFELLPDGKLLDQFSNNGQGSSQMVQQWQHSSSILGIFGRWTVLEPKSSLCRGWVMGMTGGLVASAINSGSLLTHWLRSKRIGDYLHGFKFRETFLIIRGLVSAGYWFSRDREDYNAASKDPACRHGDHVRNLFYIKTRPFCCHCLCSLLTRSHKVCVNFPRYTHSLAWWWSHESVVAVTLGWWCVRVFHE